MTTGLITQACIAQSLQDMTPAEKSAVCASLNCAPTALTQNPGTGAALPVTAPAAGTSPFFVLTPSNVLHVWNGTAYVPATAFQQLVTASGGGGGGAPTSASIAAAICATASVPYEANSAVKLFGGATCAVQTFASNRDAKATRNTEFLGIPNSLTYVDVPFTTLVAANFGTWNAAGTLFTFSRPAKAIVTARGVLVDIRNSIVSGTVSVFALANLNISGVQLMGIGSTHTTGQTAGGLVENSHQFNLVETRLFATGDTVKLEVLAFGTAGATTPADVRVGAGSIETALQITEII